MISSFDTNILVYAADENAAEHPAAIRVMEDALGSPGNWVLADQVLFEFYKALRNPKVFRHPLGAREAAARIRFLRESSGFFICCYELEMWSRVLPVLEKSGTPYQRTHDVLLGATLMANGVERFYTRNRKDFTGAGFRELINPIDP